MRATLVLLLGLCCAALTECQRRRIEQLPRLNFHPDFRQYSGYLTSTGGRRLFYWLVESSEVKPADAPLLLWLNGGPGCSSVGGLLMTNGPFLANDRAELDRNEQAWNRLANVLYIDSPNGVGLSEPGPIDPSVLNDAFTTELNLRALLHFFTLFPEYRGRPFYMAGESYAGIYIPLLAHAIQRSQHFPGVINLRGIAVGNGLHVPTKHPSMAESRKQFSIVMGMKMGDIDLWSLGEMCSSFNCYNIAKPCHQQESAHTYPCLNSSGLTTFLNAREVREALGVNESVSGEYWICSRLIFDAYQATDRDVLSDLTALATGNVSVLLYHGTLDLVIPANVTQSLLDTLPANGSRELDTNNSVWHYCTNEHDRLSTQIGGIQKSYMKGMLRFRTVIGAGHTVPTDRPDMGLQILADFLRVGNNSQQWLGCRIYRRASLNSVPAASTALLALVTSCLLFQT